MPLNKKQKTNVSSGPKETASCSNAKGNTDTVNLILTGRRYVILQSGKILRSFQK